MTHLQPTPTAALTPVNTATSVGPALPHSTTHSAIEADLLALAAREYDPSTLRASWSMQMKAPTRGWLTANDRMHHMAKASHTKALRQSAHLRARAARAPQLSSAHIVVVFHHRDRRRRDVANLHPTVKALIDGLVDARLLPDDDDAHLTGPDLRTGSPVSHGRPQALTVLVYARPALDAAAVPLAVPTGTASLTGSAS